MKPITEQVHDFLSPLIQSGDTVIDATAGNGYDTLFLSRLVGEQGKVYAVDIQPEAIHQTKERLEHESCFNVEYFCGSHAELLELIPQQMHGRISAIMFNLGYLPGGDKSKITQTASTLQGTQAGTELLQAGGVLTVMAYPGHPGGEEETTALYELLASLPSSQFEFEDKSQPTSNQKSPRFYLLKKK